MFGAYYGITSSDFNLAQDWWSTRSFVTAGGESAPSWLLWWLIFEVKLATNGNQLVTSCQGEGEVQSRKIVGFVLEPGLSATETHLCWFRKGFSDERQCPEPLCCVFKPSLTLWVVLCFVFQGPVSAFEETWHTWFCVLCNECCHRQLSREHVKAGKPRHGELGAIPRLGGGASLATRASEVHLPLAMC